MLELNKHVRAKGGSSTAMDLRWALPVQVDGGSTDR